MSNTAQRSRKRTAVLAVLAVIVVIALIAAIWLTINSLRTRPQQDAGNGKSPAAAASSSTSKSAKSTSTDTDSDGDEQDDEAKFPNAIPADKERNGQAFALLVRNQRDDPRAMGRYEAPVTMLEFEDFSCPLCAVYQTRIAPQLRKYVDNGTLRIEFHDLAIFERRFGSNLGAAAARAAGQQGKFWDFVHVSFAMSAESHPHWNPDLAMQIAKQAGVPDLNRFKQDMMASSTLKAVRDETSQVTSLGVQGTPAFLINDRFISGAQDVKIFDDTIRAAAAAAQKQAAHK